MIPNSLATFTTRFFCFITRRKERGLLESLDMEIESTDPEQKLTDRIESFFAPIGRVEGN